MWSFISISDSGPLFKRGRESQTLNDTSVPSQKILLPENESSDIWYQYFTGSALLCVCQIQWKGQAWPRGRGLAQMWNWQMNSMNRLPPLRGQTQIWGDFTLESSTTPKSMVCEFWIEALVSTLCPDIPVLTGGWWYYVSWGFHSWCLFMLTIGLE